jgi:hypothetical protein
MYIELDQRFWTDGLEAVDLASLDYQDLAGTDLEFIAFDNP